MATTRLSTLLPLLGRRALSTAAPLPQRLNYLRAGAGPGAFLPPSECRVSVDDRGFLFADGLYEVTKAYGGFLFTEEEHLARLRRGLSEIDIGADDAGRLSRRDRVLCDRHRDQPLSRRRQPARRSGVERRDAAG